MPRSIPFWMTKLGQLWRLVRESHEQPLAGEEKHPPEVGPADTAVTGWIEKTANALLADELRAVRRLPYERARRAASTHPHDYVTPYVDDLAQVIDMETIRGAGT